MKCTYCESTIEPGNSFCVKCGKKLLYQSPSRLLAPELGLKIGLTIMSLPLFAIIFFFMRYSIGPVIYALQEGEWDEGLGRALFLVLGIGIYFVFIIVPFFRYWLRRFVLPKFKILVELLTRQTSILILVGLVAFLLQNTLNLFDSPTTFFIVAALVWTFVSTPLSYSFIFAWDRLSVPEKEAEKQATYISPLLSFVSDLKELLQATKHIYVVLVFWIILFVIFALPGLSTSPQNTYISYTEIEKISDLLDYLDWLFIIIPWATLIVVLIRGKLISVLLGLVLVGGGFLLLSVNLMIMMSIGEMITDGYTLSPGPAIIAATILSILMVVGGIACGVLAIKREDEKDKSLSY